MVESALSIAACRGGVRATDQRRDARCGDRGVRQFGQAGSGVAKGDRIVIGPARPLSSLKEGDTVAVKNSPEKGAS